MRPAIAKMPIVPDLSVDPQETVLGDMTMTTIGSVIEYVEALRDSRLVPVSMDAPLSTIVMVLRNLPENRIARIEAVDTIIRLAMVLSAVPKVACERAELSALAVEIMALRLNLRD